MDKDIFVLDSGEGRKLERFGPYRISRPCSQAVWRRSNSKLWKNIDAEFSRNKGNRWHFHTPLPEVWEVSLSGLTFQVSPTDFGHLGIFPEHAEGWVWMEKLITPKIRVLNLFAYSGGATLALARAGAEVCHLDASPGMVSWARENAKRNRLASAPIRWIVDDVKKFIDREIRRGRKYDAIVLDPPSFGRGNKGQIFKIEEDLLPLLDGCQRLLSDNPLFVFLSCHTPGYTPTVLKRLLEQMMEGGQVKEGELLLPGTDPLPSGTYARWSRDGTDDH